MFDFHKYHGLGNDFIIVDALERPELAARPDWGARAVRWCDRRRGIGADGVLLLCSDPGADLRMRIFNSDGSEAQMCGNGVRCVARYVMERRGRRERGLTVATGRGLLVIESDVREGRFVGATVDMGAPILGARAVPVRTTGERVVDAPLIGLDPSLRGWAAELTASCGLDARMTCVSMGNPHAVFFCSDVSRVPLDRAGPMLEAHALFPEMVNVHFVQVMSPMRVVMRTWERGAGATAACGTGACAVAVAGALTGRTGRTITAALPGGELGVRWDEGTGHVFMTGPAEEVFAGRAEVS